MTGTRRTIFPSPLIADFSKTDNVLSPNLCANKGRGAKYGHLWHGLIWWLNAWLATRIAQTLTRTVFPSTQPIRQAADSMCIAYVCAQRSARELPERTQRSHTLNRAHEHISVTQARTHCSPARPLSKSIPRWFTHAHTLWIEQNWVLISYLGCMIFSESARGANLADLPCILHPYQMPYQTFSTQGMQMLEIAELICSSALRSLFIMPDSSAVVRILLSALPTT